jgi:hypothetical protein
MRSVSSPAGRRRRRPRSITTTPPSRTATGRRSTASSARRRFRRRPSAKRSFQRQRHHYAHGMGGLLMVGDPGPHRADACASASGWPPRHRLLLRQLPQGAAVLLRRGASRGSSAWASARSAASVTAAGTTR